MLKFTLTPFDLLFFGDARPFDKGSDAHSIFPPLPNTIASAIFARIYAEKGITYNGQKLIDAVYGPFIQKDGKIYFPAPMDLFIKGNNIVLLSPLSNQDGLIDISNTDLDKKIKNFLWLKGKADKETKSFCGYISLEGLKKWYQNNIPSSDDLLCFSKVFEKEERIGINIDHEKGTTQEEDGLYRVNYIRLKKDVSFVCWINFNINNLSTYFNSEEEILKFYNQCPRVLKLGGEMKAVYYKCEQNDFVSIFNDFHSNNSQLEKILFLTPGMLSNSNKNILELIPNFNCGIIGKYFIAGVNSKGVGTKTVRAIPCGTVLYRINQNNEKKEIIDFFENNETFIGANLILKKF